jgi:ferredoxin/flavodoxin---NADP+ reductase
MWCQGEVVGRIHWHDHLFSLKIKADIAPFQAGQFVKLAHVVGEKRIARAYSMINAPNEPELELLITHVQGGQLSSHLARLQLGDKIAVSTRATGFMVISELPKARDLWMMATGSGVSPYLSMLRQGDLWQQFERVYFVYGVRHTQDLAYADELEQWQRTHPLHWLPCVTREPGFNGITQRIPEALLSGSLEENLGATIAAPTSHVLLCGNPDFIKATTVILKEKQLTKHLRRAPGQISVEKYW